MPPTAASSPPSSSPRRRRTNRAGRGRCRARVHAAHPLRGHDPRRRPPRRAGPRPRGRPTARAECRWLSSWSVGRRRQSDQLIGAQRAAPSSQFVSVAVISTSGYECDGAPRGYRDAGRPAPARAGAAGEPCGASCRSFTIGTLPCVLLDGGCHRSALAPASARAVWPASPRGRLRAEVSLLARFRACFSTVAATA